MDGDGRVLLLGLDNDEEEIKPPEQERDERDEVQQEEPQQDLHGVDRDRPGHGDQHAQRVEAQVENQKQNKNHHTIIGQNQIWYTILTQIFNIFTDIFFIFYCFGREMLIHVIIISLYVVDLCVEEIKK